MGLPRSLILACLLLLAGSERVVGATRVTQNCSEALFFVSGGVVAASLIYDIASAPASARRYNQAHLSIAPVVDPRHGSFGLTASWSFGRSSRLASRYVAAPATKSPSTAFVLSFASTVVPIGVGAVMADRNIDAGWVLIFGGGIIGPSVGHFYVGESGRGLGTAALRAGGTLLGLLSIAPCFGD